MMGQVLQLLATALLQHRTPLRGAPSYHGRASQQEGLTQKEMVFQQGRASQQGGGDPKKGGRTSRGGRPSKGRSPRKESVLQQGRASQQGEVTQKRECVAAEGRACSAFCLHHAKLGAPAPGCAMGRRVCMGLIRMRAASLR